jgi:hypothetical protein
MPDRVDLSLEEGKALFKVCLQYDIPLVPFGFSRRSHVLHIQTLLREKDVNPLHPWDTSLPLFISDPRYVLLPSVSARREAFDEYCRERARELRASRVKKEKEDPKEEFEKLLTTEVKSTRITWADFRRQWKKDKRFHGWGRDDREREKRFRGFLKELGESTCSAILCGVHELDFFQESVHSPKKRRRTSSHFSERVALQKRAPYGTRWATPSVHYSTPFYNTSFRLRKQSRRILAMMLLGRHLCVGSYLTRS